MALLPKAATPLTFRISPPLSPVKAGAGTRKIPIIPKEARRKPKNSSFQQKEPASPKVSCMGQVIKKKNKCKPNRLKQPQHAIVKEEEEKKVSIMMKIFKAASAKGANKNGGGVKVDVADRDHRSGPGVVVQRVHSLSEISQHASGRGSGSSLELFGCGVFEENCEEQGKVKGANNAIRPRKEVNLWKRRNKDPPIPLQM
ncbi:hypothetical protein AB3S75_002353 [Citrus x aurantiifolia]